jgi:3',5'-cyclic AMP phosphodiesterase CpdA
MSFFFIHMADPQFGFFASVSQLNQEQIDERRQRGVYVRLAPEKITGFADETILYEKAIAEANRLRPDFVVMGGDMTNDADDLDQLAELRRITAKLDGNIPIYWVAGNHDAANRPTPETLVQYRQRFGEDNYSFDHQGSHFVVINSCVCFDPTDVPDEWDRLVAFLETDLRAARAKGGKHIIVFLHHPLFLDSPNDPDGYWVIPSQQRVVLLDIMKANKVSAVFAGHVHRNNLGQDGDLQMVTTGAVGYPLGDDPSGVRVVKVLDDSIEHEYFGLDDLPQTLER